MYGISCKESVIMEGLKMVTKGLIEGGDLPLTTKGVLIGGSWAWLKMLWYEIIRLSSEIVRVLRYNSRI